MILILSRVNNKLKKNGIRKVQKWEMMIFATLHDRLVVWRISFWRYIILLDSFFEHTIMDFLKCSSPVISWPRWHTVCPTNATMWSVWCELTARGLWYQWHCSIWRLIVLYRWPGPQAILIWSPIIILLSRVIHHRFDQFTWGIRLSWSKKVKWWWQGRRRPKVDLFTDHRSPDQVTCFGEKQ